MTRPRLHRDESRAENGLVIADRVVRSHGRVDVAFLVVGENPHIHRLGECLEYLGVVQALLLEDPVTVAPLPGLLHQPVPGRGVDVIGERLVGLVAEILPEVSLKVPHPLMDSLFGIFLHLVVDGRVDPQAIPVKVVRSPVRLLVLLQPAVEVIGRP